MIPESGKIGTSLKVYGNHTVETRVHPNTSVSLDFSIKHYEDLKVSVLGICELLNTIEWMGFDIGMTTKGFKIMENNTHPGIEFGQLMCPMMKHPVLGPYIQRKLENIENLNQGQKKRRNNLIH